MSQDSRLSITIDSRPAKKNADELSGALDRVEQSGEGAAASAQNLSQVSVTLGSNLGKMASAATRALGQIEKSTASTDQQISALTAQVAQLAGGFNAFSASQVAVNAQLTRLASSLEKTAGAGRQADTSMEGVSRSSKAAEASIDQQRKELAQLIGQINPAVSALDRLDGMQQKLAKYRKAGLVDSDTFTEYTQRINTMRDAIGETADGMNRGGMSAKAYNAAMRGLPAQFTDIAVSLQAGQAPLTVFLQQGGQLKDMFGGVGPAAKAMGGYILGLVNPMTVAAAAAGVLAYAFYDVEREASAFNRALYDGAANSGQTLSSMNRAAKSAADITGNLSEAKAAVVALTMSGRLSETQFRNLAQASAAVAKITGQGAGEVAKSFGDLGDSATVAAQKISQQYGLITFEQYELIRSLEEQGRKQEANDRLSESLNQAAQKRLKQYRESLSEIEKDWDSIGTAISNAYSRIKAELFPDQNKEVEIAQRILDRRKQGGLLGAVSNLFSFGDNSYTALRDTVKLGQQRQESAQAEAKAQAEITNQEQKRIATSQALADLAKGARTQTERLQDDLKELDKIRAESRKAGGYGAKEEAEYTKSRKNIEQQIADIKEREAKKKRPKNPNRGVSEAENTFARLYGQYDPAAQAARTLTKEQGQLDLALSKGKITQEEYGKALAQASLNYAAAIKGAQGLTQAEQYRAQLERQLSAQRSEYGIAAAGVGMGDQQVQRMQQRIQLEQETNDRVLQLRTELANASNEKQRQELQAQIDLEEEYLPKRLAALQTGFNQYDVAVGDSMNGWNAALANFQTDAANVAGQTQSLFQGAFGNIQSSFGSAFEAMALDGQTFGESVSQITRSVIGGVINSLGQMAAQWITNQALQLVFGQTSAAIAAQQIAQVGAVTAAETAGAATVATAKVAADGVVTASSLAATATTTTAQVAAAGTTLSAWLPAALVASVGSFGAAAIVGGTALLAAFALIKGFSSGGYTGRGGVNEPAGVVHKGEVVWSQADIKRFGGVSAVESLRTGGSSAIKTAVRSDPSPSRQASSSSRSSASTDSDAGTITPIYQTIHINGDVSPETVSMIQQVGVNVAQALRKDIDRNGPIMQSIRRKL